MMRATSTTSPSFASALLRFDCPHSIYVHCSATTPRPPSPLFHRPPSPLHQDINVYIHAFATVYLPLFSSIPYPRPPWVRHSGATFLVIGTEPRTLKQSPLHPNPGLPHPNTLVRVATKSQCQKGRHRKGRCQRAVILMNSSAHRSGLEVVFADNLGYLTPHHCIQNRMIRTILAILMGNPNILT